MAPKTIILTGASRGIGLAIAEYLLARPAEPHRLVLVSRSRTPLEELKARAPSRVEIVVADMADVGVGQQAVDVAMASFGRLDAIIVNHGTLGDVARVADADVAAWQHTFNVNFFSAVAVIKAAIPHLRASSGRIVLTSSGAALNAYSTWGAYGASKAAMNHLAATLASEEPTITTVAVRPGVVDTAMQQELRDVHAPAMDEKDRDKFLAAKINGSLLRPEEPGRVIARLAVDATKDLSGQFLSWNDKSLGKFGDW